MRGSITLKEIGGLGFLMIEDVHGELLWLKEVDGYTPGAMVKIIGANGDIFDIFKDQTIGAVYTIKHLPNDETELHWNPAKLAKGHTA